MFQKMLIANRGEIAVRVIRACRELGIATVALYEAADRASLHVRHADECHEVPAARSFFDQTLMLELARRTGADAIHPGYGFLAENAAFAQACADAGVVFVGPSADLLTRLTRKLPTLAEAAALGFPTVHHSDGSWSPDELERLTAAADSLGYPVVIKPCSGGRGRGERLAADREALRNAIQRSRREIASLYDNDQLYLERAIPFAHQIGVQIIADGQGHVIHLGEREGSIVSNNQKLIEEAPSPALSAEKRTDICRIAVGLTRAIGYQGVGTVEFVTDTAGNPYFTEFKARLQVEHVLSEMLTGIDLVKWQIRLAAGEPLALHQDDVQLRGAAMMVRIHAEDPWARFLPGPGRLVRARFPGGMGVRVDTYVYCGCDVPPDYDSLIAKLTVKSADRPNCLQRLAAALGDTKLLGTPTNVAMLQRIVASPDFVAGRYDTGYLQHPWLRAELDEAVCRDVAVMAAILYVQRNQIATGAAPERQPSSWQRAARQLS